MAAKNIMSKLMVVILSLVILLCIFIGVYALYLDISSFTGYIFLGFGIGGIIAFWDMFFGKEK